MEIANCLTAGGHLTVAINVTAPLNLMQLAGSTSKNATTNHAMMLMKKHVLLTADLLWQLMTAAV